MNYICVLKLSGIKYYICKTTNINKFSNNYCKILNVWTNNYEPINIVEYFEENDFITENKVTLDYMFHYGINNVRGGSYSSLILENNTIEKIIEIINIKKEKLYFSKFNSIEKINHEINIINNFIKNIDELNNYCYYLIIKEDDNYYEINNQDLIKIFDLYSNNQLVDLFYEHLNTYTSKFIKKYNILENDILENRIIPKINEIFTKINKNNNNFVFIDDKYYYIQNLIIDKRLENNKEIAKINKYFSNFKFNYNYKDSNFNNLLTNLYYFKKKLIIKKLDIYLKN